MSLDDSNMYEVIETLIENYLRNEGTNVRENQRSFMKILVIIHYRKINACIELVQY